MTEDEFVKRERALSRWFWVAVLFVGCGLTGGFLFSLWMAAKIARRLLG